VDGSVEPVAGAVVAGKATFACAVAGVVVVLALVPVLPDVPLAVVNTASAAEASAALACGCAVVPLPVSVSPVVLPLAAVPVVVVVPVPVVPPLTGAAGAASAAAVEDVAAMAAAAIASGALGLLAAVVGLDAEGVAAVGTMTGIATAIASGVVVGEVTLCCAPADWSPEEVESLVAEPLSPDLPSLDLLEEDWLLLDWVVSELPPELAVPGELESVAEVPLSLALFEFGDVDAWLAEAEDEDEDEDEEDWFWLFEACDASFWGRCAGGSGAGGRAFPRSDELLLLTRSEKLAVNRDGSGRTGFGDALK
jgi:hypothetical protein